MNKIVLNFGLLVFFISLIIFSQNGADLKQVLIKSFVVFFVITFMFSILAIIFIKAINKASVERVKKLNENSLGTNTHE